MNIVKEKDNIKIKISGIAAILMYLCAGAFILYSVYLAFSTDIWYDELFSMEFASRDILDMIFLTAADVHPPLYYIIVHLFIVVLKGASIDAVIAAKLASIFPFFILYIYSLTVIRRKFGILTGALFSLAVIGMPNISEYLVEIRMYGWAILFVTAMCIHSLDFVENNKEKQIIGLKWGKALPVFLYGIMACYTQYYAAVAVFFVYLYLIIWSVRKNVMQLGIVLISANLTAVSFFPWISVVISQVGAVSENYWIQELGLRSLGGVVKYLTKPYFTTEIIAVLLAVIMSLIIFITIVLNIKNEKMQLLFMPIFGIVLFGFAASFIIRPFFIYRYMLPGIGAFWLGIIIAAGNIIYEWGKTKENKAKENINRESKTIENKKASDDDIFKDEKKTELKRYKSYPGNRFFKAIAASLCVFICIFSIRDFWAFRGNELYRRVNMEKTLELFDSLAETSKDQNLVIICNFDHVCALMSYYLNERINRDDIEVVLYGYEPESLIKDLLPNVGGIEGAEDIEAYLQSGKKVLFLGSFNSREDILRDWNENYNIENENQGSYLLERYWFDVFELHLGAI